MSVMGGPSIIDSDLVLSLDPTNIKCYAGTGVSVTDLTRNFSTGTLTNGASVSSNAFQFDGTNDFLTMQTNSFNLSRGYTAIMIARWNSFGGGSFQFNQPSANLYINFYNGGSNKLRWETGGGSAFSSNASLSTGVTTFVAGTYAGGTSATARIYINGVLDNSATLNSATSITNGTLILGEYAGYMNGSISYFMFYNKELSGTEILQNFNAIRQRFGI